MVKHGNRPGASTRFGAGDRDPDHTADEPRIRAPGDAALTWWGQELRGVVGGSDDTGTCDS